MKNHGCLVIGINQYHYIQPLNYAQEDAESLYNFLVESGGFSAENTVLLTDHSPEQWGVSTRPNRQILLEHLSRICSPQNQEIERLWFFFSGYGMVHQGEDYLVPLDGNLTDIINTGISLRFLLESLKQSHAQNILVLLDINRSQVNKGGEPIGQRTVELAQEMGIPLLLSCQLDQVSRETAALRHGFFTAALLEGLRSGETLTLNSLENWLKHRLPELSERHLRPRQDPLLIVSDQSKINQGILPNLIQSGQPDPASYKQSSAHVIDQTLTDVHTTERGMTMESSHQKVGDHGLNSETNSGIPEPDQSDDIPTASGKENLQLGEDETLVEDKSFVWHLLQWCIGTALVLLGVALWVQWDAIFATKPPQPKPSSPTVKKMIPPTAETVKSATKPNNKSQSMTVSQPSPAPEQQSAKVSSQSLLNQSKSLLKDGSASSFNDAITLARQIPPNDPLYPEAQSDIQRWSANILDIAKGRSIQGDYKEAIRAAEIVPDLSQPLYQESRDLIKEWQTLVKQQEANVAILTQAKAKIKRGQASSYSQAIEEAGRIKPDQVKYPEAQDLINEWSEVILKIAQLRASQGRFPQAIEAAALVPPETPSYKAAQQGINEWKNKK